MELPRFGGRFEAWLVQWFSFRLLGLGLIAAFRLRPPLDLRPAGKRYEFWAGSGVPDAKNGASGAPLQSEILTTTIPALPMAPNGIRPSSESAGSTIVLSSAGHDPSSPAGVAAAKESIQTNAQRMIGEVNRSAKQIDSKKLDAGNSSRYALAQKLMRNADTTYADHDFAAAASLAKKASIFSLRSLDWPKSAPANP